MYINKSVSEISDRLGDDLYGSGCCYWKAAAADNGISEQV